jgi:hypothetical protein
VWRVDSNNPILNNPDIAMKMRRAFAWLVVVLFANWFSTMTGTALYLSHQPARNELLVAPRRYHEALCLTPPPLNCVHAAGQTGILNLVWVALFMSQIATIGGRQKARRTPALAP